MNRDFCQKNCTLNRDPYLSRGDYCTVKKSMEKLLIRERRRGRLRSCNILSKGILKLCKSPPPQKKKGHTRSSIFIPAPELWINMISECKWSKAQIKMLTCWKIASQDPPIEYTYMIMIIIFNNRLYGLNSKRVADWFTFIIITFKQTLRIHLSSMKSKYIESVLTLVLLEWR